MKTVRIELSEFMYLNSDTMSVSIIETDINHFTLQGNYIELRISNDNIKEIPLSRIKSITIF